jgi:hypothetical protein
MSSPECEVTVVVSGEVAVVRRRSNDSFRRRRSEESVRSRPSGGCIRRNRVASSTRRRARSLGSSVEFGADDEEWREDVAAIGCEEIGGTGREDPSLGRATRSEPAVLHVAEDGRWRRSVPVPAS